jgi:S-adenosylmethionine hydrolase
VRPNGIITLLTDFGEQDYYVPAMKGAMLRVCPTLKIVDAGHRVPPQRVATAAYLLAHYAMEFPEGTVHLVVVDPGVGSSRKVLVARLGGWLVVGPDNGFASPLARAYMRAALEPEDSALGQRARQPGLDVAPEASMEDLVPQFRCADVEALGYGEASATFHGRDLFAPLAARLACGDLAFHEVGPLFTPVGLPEPRIVSGEGVLAGEVIHVDRFGNLVTNIGAERLSGRTPRCLEIAKTRVDRFVRTYADAPAGTLVFLLGSGGEVEISLVNGDAAAHLRASAGDPVLCTLR